MAPSGTRQLTVHSATGIILDKRLMRDAVLAYFSLFRILTKHCPFPCPALALDVATLRVASTATVVGRWVWGRKQLKLTYVVGQEMGVNARSG